MSGSRSEDMDGGGREGVALAAWLHRGRTYLGRAREGGLMLTIVIALVFALARINQADDAVSSQCLHVKLRSFG